MTKFPQSIRELSCLPFSDTINSVSLTAGAAEAIDIPEGASFVIFSGTGDYYIRANGTAAVPGDVTDGTASEINPTMRSLVNVTSLSAIAPADCVVTAAFYSA